MHLCTLPECSLKGQRIFLRADLNVPLISGVPQDDYRLKAILPTLHFLVEHGATFIILASHIGNPTTPDPALSTQNLIPWFKNQGFSIEFVETIENLNARVNEMTFPEPTHLFLLENVRFFAGEKGKSDLFAQQLAHLGDVYVNDAFGTMHRDDASITLLPKLFAPSHRAAGLCVAREIEALDQLKNSPQQPFMLVIGGSKVADKIPLLEHLFSQPVHKRPQTCLIGGLIGLACLQAHGNVTSATPFDAETLEAARKLIQAAELNKVTIILPRDFATIPAGEALGAQPRITPIEQLTSQHHCVDIGPSTRAAFTDAISTAHTIFANGTMGMYEYEPYQQGTRAVVTAISHNSKNTVIGGGDCAAAVHLFNLEKNIGFISTGGGATLAYLAAVDPMSELPGLKALVGLQD